MKTPFYLLLIICFFITFFAKAQPVSDPRTLDKFSQINYTHIKLVDLLEKRENTVKLLDLLPTLSQFIITQLDSVDIYEVSIDTVLLTIYSQNDKYVGASGYGVVYKDHILENILIDPRIEEKTTVDKFDRRRFEYTIRVKEVIAPLHGKREKVTWLRYILNKKYILPSEKTSPVLKDSKQPLLLK